ncbi:MAG TPA: hypothetical protein VKR58_13470, partial [Aquella sp.]|nr:hypothetical protein [Aquella sp.]
TLTFPKKDREGNKHNGIAFIYFNNLIETRLDDIVLTRLFINYTKWPDTNQEVHCYWRKPHNALGKFPSVPTYTLNPNIPNGGSVQKKPEAKDLQNAVNEPLNELGNFETGNFSDFPFELVEKMKDQKEESAWVRPLGKDLWKKPNKTFKPRKD